MHLLSFTVMALWILTAISESILAVAMVRKHVPARFPLFFTYVAADALLTALMFSLDVSPAVSGVFYSNVSYPRMAVTAALQFAVIWEVFNYTFTSFAALHRFGRPLFRIALVTFFLAGIAAAEFTHNREIYPGMALLHQLQQAAGILRLGLLGSLFAFSLFWGLPHKSFVFGIALGMGTDAAINLAAAAIKQYFGLTGNDYLNLLTQGSSALAVLIWLFYLYLPDPPGKGGDMKDGSESDLEIWNKELQRLSR